MKFIEIHENRKAQQLIADDERMSALQSHVTVELEDAIAQRFRLEALWRELMRMYDGVPKNPVKNFPIENAPNIEVTLGAIASDAIYAQAYDAIFSVEPFVTARGIPKRKKDEEYNATVKALQRFINHITSTELNIKKLSKRIM